MLGIMGGGGNVLEFYFVKKRYVFYLQYAFLYKIIFFN